MDSRERLKVLAAQNGVALMALFGKVKGARAFWHGEAPETPEMVAKIEQAIEDLRLKLFVVWAEDYEAARQPWEVEAPNPRAAVEY